MSTYVNIEISEPLSPELAERGESTGTARSLERFHGFLEYRVFVEVPILTFNPVKTVFDLLRDVHQPE